MTDTDPEETKVLRDVDFLYVNLRRGPDGIVASTVVRDRSTGRLIEVPGGPVTARRGRQYENDQIHPPSVPVRVVPPEHRVCRERTEEEQAAIDAVAPTTGSPYGDEFWVPDGCTGYYREDADWGDVMTHDPARPCSVHRPVSLRDLLADPTDDED